jgi:exodeoxyribonuclease VII small subunit
MSKEKETTFRAELERLEGIVRGLESPDLELDDALALFEEGVGRLKAARELLNQGEISIKKVIESADGTLKTRDDSH